MPQCRSSMRLGGSILSGSILGGSILSGSVLVGALAGAALLCGVGGCASRAHSYRSNPSPELDTLSMRRDDMDNRMTVTNDTNLRQFNRDVGYFFLLDRPSRLTPHPVSY
ncbi:MAG: hypothetical protein ACKVZJ_06250 [Phycisphaerales bacterium]